MAVLLAALVLCLGPSGGLMLADAASPPSNSSSQSILQPLFSSPLAVTPIELSFVPARSNVFFLVPNQTVNTGQVQAAPAQPQSLGLPIGLGGQDSTSPVAAGPSAQSSSSIELRNDSLVLHNPFAAVPYQSNAETIASLIESIFSNFTLQSLPPENLIFGALPSPNSTITRTIVRDAFGNDQMANFGPPTETTTGAEGLLPGNLFSADNANPFEPEVEVTHQGSGLASFGAALEEHNSPLPIATQVTIVPTTERPSSFTPTTVTPVAPTVGAAFESSRIEPVQSWSTARQVASSFFTQPALPTRPPTTKAPRIAPLNLSPPLPLPITQSKISSPSRIWIPRSVKPSKLTTLYKSPLKYSKATSTQLKANSLFKFELNNKKILGNSFSGLVTRSTHAPKLLPLAPKKLSDISTLETPNLERASVQPPEPDQQPKWLPNAKVPILDNLVNIISLPNYKFYLGKKT